MQNKICDIHAHIVPGVDDGAVNFDMSVKLIRMAYSQGTRNIVCTSHDGCNIEKYFYNFEKLKQIIRKENIELNLYPGCEVYCNTSVIKEVIYGLNNKTIPTINGTKYILVEFYPRAPISDITYCLSELHNHGYKTVIAHTERYASLSMNDKWISFLLQMGCLFQVNAYSFNDETDGQIKMFARKLLKEKHVTFIGSDAHRTNHRQYEIKNGINYIYENCDSEYAKDVCYRNAHNILNMK